MRNALPAALILAALSALPGCGKTGTDRGSEMTIQERLDQYTTVRLTADLSTLSSRQRQMIPLLIDAAREMDAIYWQETWGDPRDLTEGADADTRRLLEINYGPWDRLNGDEPFVDGIGPKPAGARFYPADMTREEFDAVVATADADEAARLKGLYTMVRRGADGSLQIVPYHELFAEHVQRAAELLKQAAVLAEDPGFRRYLQMRSQALLDDDYGASDIAWMDMKDNQVDLVVGPIETYEDQLFGYKAAHEAYVLIKDMEWSARLARYAQLLPELQRRLPVEAPYKQEKPGTDSDLNAYDAVYYAGDANAGAKTIAINLPNDEQVQLQRGTRRLQLKNAMRAKFERIMAPISGRLIAADQRGHVTFDAFFANTMFHEVAHGLGIKQTLNGRGTVRNAMKEEASALEEGKADVLGLFMVTQLREMGELDDADLMDNYVTFIAGIFRSIRFGASDAHARANLARFNFFQRMGAFQRDPETGMYRVDAEKMGQAVDTLSRKILTLQGDGDYEGVKAYMEEYSVIGEDLMASLAVLRDAGIPVDVVFEQGPEVLGIQP